MVTRAHAGCSTCCFLGSVVCVAALSLPLCLFVRVVLCCIAVILEQHGGCRVGVPFLLVFVIDVAGFPSPPPTPAHTCTLSDRF